MIVRKNTLGKSIISINGKVLSTTDNIPDFNGLIINSNTDAVINVAGGPSSGQIAEILMWTKSLNDEETISVENYLAIKWNLVKQVEVNHPIYI
jgi:hypothetical protein